MNKLLQAIKMMISVDLILPFVLLITYIILLVIVRGVVPTPEELISTFGSLYQKYGYEIIFASAFLEALVLVNLFVPGTLTVALGVIFARAGYTHLSLVLLFASLGAMSGYILDYFLGHFGFAEVIKKLGYQGLIKEAHKQLVKFGQRGLIFGFFLPNVAAFLSLAVGTSDIGFKKFITIAIPATIFWTTLWGLIIYALGDIFLVILTKYSFLLLLLAIAGIILGRLWKGSSKGNT